MPLLLGVERAITAGGQLFKRHKAATKEVNALTTLYVTSAQHHCGRIPLTQYCKMLRDLPTMVNKKDKKERTAALEKLYLEAEVIVGIHFSVLEAVERRGASSLADYIERFPDSALLTGVFGMNQYSYEEQAKTSAQYLADQQTEYLAKYEKALSDTVQLLNGDVARIKNEFNKIRSM